MFRRITQEKLEKKRFADDDRRHMISVLGHVVCATIERASMQECKVVAESLVRKYPFLKEHVMVLLYIHVDGQFIGLFFSLQYSWQQFLNTKCQNINRVTLRSGIGEGGGGAGEEDDFW